MSNEIKYNLSKNLLDILEEPSVSYLSGYSNQGMPVITFEFYEKQLPLSLLEWSEILQLSERTLQRYKKNNSTIETIYTEKILEMIMIYRKGKDVFGSIENFHEWLKTPNVSLGEEIPFSLLKNSFGQQLILEELGRIEHGIVV